MCDFPKGRCECGKKGGRHDQAVFVHGKVVVDAVEDKVQRDSNAIVRQIARSKSQQSRMGSIAMFGNEEQGTY